MVRQIPVPWSYETGSPSAQKTLGLRPMQRWHGLQEFVQRETRRQMIDRLARV
jgi:hypothetical protein